MKSGLAGAVIAALSLCACQTANQTRMQWVQIRAGDVFDVADAKCRLLAQQFYENCMITSGWKQVPLIPMQPAKKPRPVKA